MATRKKQPSSVPEKAQQEQPVLLPDYPDLVRKAYGPVIDSVMSQEVMEAADYLVNDATTEKVTGGKSLPIQTRVMLSYEGIDFDIQGRTKLKPFDREVIDAVASLAQQNDLITPAMIYRVMMGKRDYQYVSPAQEQRVAESMNKCAFTKIKIDLADMSETGSPVGKKLRQAGIKASFSGNLLSFEVVTVSKGSKEVTCYHILTEPAIVRYAAELGKVSEFPIELLDTQVSKTERIIILQSFLLRQIDEMYREPDIPRFISAEDLYAAIDAQDDTRQHKARYRTVAMSILTEWVQKGFIANVSTRKAGKQVKGFDITLMKPELPENKGSD